MEFQKQLNESQENAKLSFFKNPGYQFERRGKKTFILKWIAGSGKDTEINETLQEPLIIDCLSDIYLESFLTWHADTDNINGLDLNRASNLSDRSAFVLKINEFNNQGNSAEPSTTGNLFNKIIIPHVIPSGGTNYRKIHKSRKLNYICSMNPTKLSSLTGTITALDGSTGLFNTNDMFLAEFVIVPRD
ncbi:MAG: hypothetical protein CL470_01545 [Acidimicrobiaceae bacterium]|nr:hypothetical protein [Acidimicrobiaceae bacterium]